MYLAASSEVQWRVENYSNSKLPNAHNHESMHDSRFLKLILSHCSKILYKNEKARGTGITVVTLHREI